MRSARSFCTQRRPSARSAEGSILRTPRFLHSKQGIVFPMLVWIWRIGIIAIILLFTVFLVRRAILINLDSSAAEAGIIFDTIMSSPGGITVTDPLTGRLVYGTVDISRIDTTYLSALLFHPEPNFFAVRVQAEDSAGTVLARAYVNEDRFIEWEPLATGLHLSGNVDHFMHTYPVTLQDHKNPTVLPPSSIIRIEVIIP